MPRALSVMLTANVTGFVAGMGKAYAAASQLDKGITAMERRMKASAVGGASAAIDHAAKNQERVNGLAKNFAVAGAVMLAGVVAAVKASADFEAQLSKVAMTGDDARANLQALRDVAMEAGTTTNYSATQAAEGLEFLAKAGVSATDSINGGLKGALNLAAAGGLEVGDAAEIAATAMAQFQLKGQDVPHIADLLAAGAGKAQGSVQQLGYALKYVGPVAAGMGVSIEETTGVLAEFANSGLLGEQAGTSFRGVLLALTSPSKVAQTEMDKLGISMYDSKGKFIGMQGAAEQLHDKLNNLTQAERNYSLGRIFGNAQVTAANVLMRGGAEGVAQWTGKVNDAGYAAEAARVRMDNLRGDLGKLGRAFQTALIEAGTDAQSPLRQTVQGLTGVVKAFAGLPPVAQNAIVRTAGTFGVLLLAAGGLTKTIGWLGSLKQNFDSIGRDATTGGLTRAGTALRGLATAGAVLGGVFIGLQAASIVMARFDDPAMVSGLDQASKKLRTFTAAHDDVPKAQKALDSFFESAATHSKRMFSFYDETGKYTGHLRTWTKDTNELERGVGTLGEAVHRLHGEEDDAKILGDFFGGLVGIRTGAKVAKDGINEVDNALSQMKPDEAALKFKEVEKAYQANHVSAQDMINDFPKLLGGLQSTADQLGVSGLTAEDYAKWMGGLVPASVIAAGAQKGLKIDAQGVATALDDSSESMQEQIAQLRALSTALLTSRDSSRNMEAAIDAANESLKKNGKTHDENTQKGRDNAAALDGIAIASQKAVDDMAANGASTEAMTTRMAKGEKAFRAFAKSIGYSGPEIDYLVSQFAKVPEQKTVRIATAGAKLSAAEAAKVNTALDKIPEEERAEIVTIAETKGADAAFAAIARVKDKQVIASTKGKIDGAKDVDAAMKRLKDRLVLAKSRGDKKGADEIRAAMGSLKDRTVYAKTKGDPSGAKVVAGAMAAVPSTKTSTITIVTRKINETIYRTYGKTGRQMEPASGGFISGPGTETSDSIPAMLSDGEYVIRAAAVRAIGLDVLHRLNSQGSGGKMPTRYAPERRFAAGGYVAAASGGAIPYDFAWKGMGGKPGARWNFDLRPVVKLIQELRTPIGDLQRETRNVAKAQAAYNKARSANAGPRRAFEKADAAYDKAVEKRENARTRNNREANEARSRVAHAHGKKQVASAKQHLAEVLRLNKAENDRLSGNATKLKNVRTKASEAYKKGADKEKDASDKLKAAQEALVQVQQEVANSARETSNSFREAYTSQTTDATDWIALMRDGARDIGGFMAQIRKLREQGLNETLIQQIVGMGAIAGGDVAGQILAGGADMAKSMNDANAALQKAADQLGFFAASGTGRVVKAASGGFIAGAGTATSDSISARLSNGEYVVNAAATAANRQLLDSLNYGRQVLDHRPVGFRYGGYVTPQQPTVQAGDSFVFNGPITPDPYAIAGAIQRKKRNALAVTGAGRRL